MKGSLLAIGFYIFLLSGQLHAGWVHTGSVLVYQEIFINSRVLPREMPKESQDENLGSLSLDERIDCGELCDYEVMALDNHARAGKIRSEAQECVSQHFRQGMIGVSCFTAGTALAGYIGWDAGKNFAEALDIGFTHIIPGSLVIYGVTTATLRSVYCLLFTTFDWRAARRQRETEASPIYKSAVWKLGGRPYQSGLVSRSEE